MIRKTKRQKTTMGARKKVSALRRESANLRLRIDVLTKGTAVLSPAARVYAKKVEGNRQRAIEFLKGAEIIDKPGTLARPYR
jgi:hypothetical protein